MSKLAAFVGHSFSPQDSQVVRQFLDYFTSLSKVGIGFTWDHAEEAEPAELSKKVRKKMEGRNVFIGICTRKEMAVTYEELSEPFLKRGFLQGKAKAFEWTASDWLLQEIGFACGREMSIVILLEEGVRRPGGLQGDIEYIPFNRDRPGDCFPKILQMFSALSPAAEVQETVSPPTEPTLGADVFGSKEGSESGNAVELEPKRNYHFEAFKAVRSDDDKLLERIQGDYAASKDGQELAAQEEFEAHILYLKEILGKGGNLQRLKEIADKQLHNATVQGYLAYAYEQYDDFENAFQRYVIASEKADNSTDESRYFASAALAKDKKGDADAETWLRAKMADPEKLSIEQQSNFLRGLRELSDRHKQEKKWLSYTEARLAASPDDEDLRFNLAYRYGDNNDQRLALYHYLKISPAKRSESTWNNIGVAYNALQVKGAAVTAYNQSKSKGGERAASNLAYLLLQAGFLDEAEKICRDVRGVDPTISSALVAISEKRKAEEGAIDSILELAEKEHRFLVKVGAATLRRHLPEGRSAWRNNLAILQVVINGPKFSAVGEYTVDVGLGALGLIASHMAGGKAQQKGMQVTYTGDVVGNVVFYKRVVTETGAIPTLLGANEREGLLLFNQTYTSAEDLFRDSKEEPQWESWINTSLLSVPA